ncbi:hypothetical protein DFJ74DRAFT_617071 [Hyaloraphidium curvatum]|nr:hypothetical protein DFJ74DRAFT_617071 [Hyaloraphidium curvatum]
MQAGGADCGPVNPLAGLVKQFADADRSLQRDRFDAAAPPPGAMRQRPIDARTARDLELADEFFRQAHAGAGPAGLRPFEMRDVGRELERVAAAGPADWAAEFHRAAHRPPPADFADLEAAFARHAPPQLQQWADDFARFDAQHRGPRITELVTPEQEAEFEAAFARAEAAAGPQKSWEQEFVAHEAESWVEEFAAQEERLAQAPSAESDETRAALARTAGLLISAVQDSANPKFKQSKFMQFMKQLRDGEVAIEGNKVVEAGGWEAEFARKEGGEAWADEFAGNAGPAGWAEEFGPKEAAGPLGGTAGDWAAEFGSAEGPRGWADEFAMQAEHGPVGAAGDWAAEFDAREKPMDAHDWAEEFRKQGMPQTAEEMEKWISDFSQEEDEESRIKEYMEMHEEQAKMDDWVAQFRKSLKEAAGDAEAEGEWGDMQDEWEKFQATSLGFRATDQRYSKYEFQPNNPYLETADTAFLRDTSRHRSLAESILALEAAVQRDPDDAQSWLMLGMRQQENEREPAAIAALRRNVMIEPDSLPGYIALAVSYINEGFRDDAYEALEGWIRHNPRYAHLVQGRPAPPGGPKQQDVVSLFLAAARSNPGTDLDADVQQALGILFNASEEYDKAVDCFEAALARRPGDYMLYNKLGATLANAKQSERAIEAYSAALDINPDYIRARYNLAISCINLGNHHEAAEHLLHALAMQQAGAPAAVKGKGRPGAFPGGGPSPMSDSIWDTLRMAMLMMSRPDMVGAVDAKDINAFRGEFDF